MVGELTWVRRLVGLWLPLAALFVFALFPFAWMAATSLKANAELYDPKSNPLWIQHPSLVHYIGLIKESNFLVWIGNTMLVALVATLISLLFGVMLAYPLARMRFPASGLLALSVGVAYLVPQTLLFVPMADLINRMRLGDSLSAVMLTYPTLLVPFCAWLLIGYFKTVPKELEEAARLDGCNTFGVFWHVMLPLSKPALTTVALFAFIGHWNDFMGPLIYTQSMEKKTLALGLAAFKGLNGTEYHLMMAASVAVLLPIIVIFFLAQRYFVQSIVSSGVKG